MTALGKVERLMSARSSRIDFPIADSQGADNSQIFGNILYPDYECLALVFLTT